jgi:hypothetical protein
MNRAQNRAARRAAFRREAKQAVGRQIASAFADYHCPDCLSEQSLVEHGPGVLLLGVRHDETCPSYRAMDLP